MVAIASARNVYNTCLRIFRARGFELWIEERGENTNGMEDVFYFAKKGEFDFAAPNPIELLGLAAIYEYKNPQKPPDSYWWMVEGEDIHDELFETAFGNE